MKRKEKMGVVIPLANEEGNVIFLLEEISKYLAENDRIYCVLDFASRDNTLTLVKTYAQKHTQVNVVWAPENTCVVDAYFKGYSEALNDSCDWILEMDGGMSHSPSQIPLFIQTMEEGVDFAAGSRFVDGGIFKGSFYRRCLSRGGTLLTNLLLRTKMHDMTSGFECFTRNALSYVVKNGVKSRGHFFQTEIRVMLHEWNWREVPITYRATTNIVPSGTIVESLILLKSLFSKQLKEGAR